MSDDGRCFTNRGSAMSESMRMTLEDRIAALEAALGWYTKIKSIEVIEKSVGDWQAFDKRIAALESIINPDWIVDIEQRLDVLKKLCSKQSDVNRLTNNGTDALHGRICALEAGLVKQRAINWAMLAHIEKPMDELLLLAFAKAIRDSLSTPSP